MVPNGGGRDAPQRPGRNIPTPPPSEVAPILTAPGNGGDLHPIGDLLQTWIGIQFERIDDLVAEAESKAASIPDLRVLRQLTGETIVLLYGLQNEVADLKAEVRSLKARLRARRW